MARQEATMRIRWITVAPLIGMLLTVLVQADALSAQTRTAPPPDSKAILEALENAFVGVADRVTPAVVNVSMKARRPEGAPGPGDNPESEQRFREFFGP